MCVHVSTNNNKADKLYMMYRCHMSKNEGVTIFYAKQRNNFTSFEPICKTQLNMTSVDRCDWRIMAGNEKRLVRDCPKFNSKSCIV